MATTYDASRRDLTASVFKDPVAGVGKIEFSDDADGKTLKGMFLKMEAEMNGFLKSAATPGLTVKFDGEKGTFTVIAVNRAPFVVMELGSSLLTLNSIIMGEEKGMPDLMLLFFQVISMFVYEVVVASLDPDYDPTKMAALVTHMREVIHDMVVMIFVLANADGDWKATFNALLPVDPGENAARVGKLTALFALQIDDGAKPIAKQFADMILIRLSQRGMVDQSQFKSIQASVNAAITRLTPKEEPLTPEAWKAAFAVVDGESTVTWKSFDENVSALITRASNEIRSTEYNTAVETIKAAQTEAGVFSAWLERSSSVVQRLHSNESLVSADYGARLSRISKEYLQYREQCANFSLKIQEKQDDVLKKLAETPNVQARPESFSTADDWWNAVCGRWTILDATKDIWSAGIKGDSPVPDVSDKALTGSDAMKALKADMSRAYVRVERLRRSYPVQVFLNMSTEAQENYLKKMALMHGIKHIPVSRLIYYKNTQSWSEVILEFIDILKRLADDTQSVEGQWRTTGAEIYSFMGNLNAPDHARSYNSLSLNVVPNNSTIKASQLKTILFINDKNNLGINPRFKFEEPLSGFHRVKYLQDHGVLQPNANVTYTSELLVGPLSCVAKEPSFAARVTTVVNSLSKEIQDLTQHALFIMGYGASGAGKTTALFGFVDGVNSQHGILKSILDALPKIKPLLTTSSVANGNASPPVRNDTEEISMTHCTVTKYEFYGFLIKDEIEQLQYSRESMKAMLKQLFEDVGGINKATRIATNKLSLTPTSFERVVVSSESGRTEWLQVQSGADAGKPRRNMMKHLRDSVVEDAERKVAPTIMNPVSSRSHVVMKFEFHDSTGNHKLADMYIADFAGVESEPDCLNDAIAKIYEGLKKDKSDKQPFYDGTLGDQLVMKQYHQQGGAGIDLEEALRTVRDDNKYSDASTFFLPSLSTKESKELFVSMVLNLQLQATLVKNGTGTSSISEIPSEIKTAYDRGLTDFLKKLPKVANKKPAEKEYLYVKGDRVLKTAVGRENLLDLLFAILPHSQRKCVTSHLYVDDDLHPLRARVEAALLEAKSRHKVTSSSQGFPDMDTYFNHNTGAVKAANNSVASALLLLIKTTYNTTEKQQDTMYKFLSKCLSADTDKTLQTKQTSRVAIDQYTQAVRSAILKCFAANEDALKAESDRLKAELDAKLAKEIVDKASLDHAKAMCLFRAAEGRVINGSLEQVRSVFADKYSTGPNTSTNIKQELSQCSTLNDLSFGDNAHILRDLLSPPSDMYPVARFVEDILSAVKKPNTIILGVFNRDITNDNPAGFEYNPCHALLQELKRMKDTTFKPHVMEQQSVDASHKQASEVINPDILKSFVDALQGHLEDKIKRVTDEFSTVPVTNTLGRTPGEASTEENTRQVNAFVDKNATVVRYRNILELCSVSPFGEQALAKLIRSQTSDNSNTSLGTLEFIDQACKQFSTNQTFGRELDPAASSTTTTAR